MRSFAAFVMGAVLLAGPAWSAGEEVSVEARVDAARIGEGDSLTLTIEVRGSNPGAVLDPDLSAMADFSIASGPSVSTSTSMVWSGGQASSSTSRQFTYVLFPRRKGTLTIPGFSIMVGSRSHPTQPIQVEVVDGKVRSAPPGPARGRGPALGRGRLAARGEGEVIVECLADRREAWVGQQILLTYKVFTQLDLVELPAPQQLPAYTGFWVEEIPVDPRATIHKVTRGGEEFLEFTLMKKALFPTTSGDLGIEETIFGMPVRVDSRDPFDSIFFTPTRTVFRRTAPLTLHVRPLPETGRPESFSGAVGRYSLEVTADRSEAQVNDALSLRVAVEGVGNIRTVGEPRLPPLSDYKKYAPRVEEKKSASGDRLEGSKTWDYVLTPLAPGDQEIPPVRFSYFDPEKGAYVESLSRPLPVRVARAAGIPDGGAPGPAPARREVTAFARDIHYIKPASALAARSIPFHRSSWFLAMLAAPILANAALYAWVRRRDRFASDAGLARGRRAPGSARRRLRQARRLLAAQRSRELPQEIASALTGYLADTLDQSAAGLTHDQIDSLLAQRGTDPTLRRDVRRCLERCDEARFAPSAHGPAQMKQLLDETGRLIARLERNGR